MIELSWTAIAIRITLAMLLVCVVSVPVIRGVAVFTINKMKGDAVAANKELDMDASPDDECREKPSNNTALSNGVVEEVNNEKVIKPLEEFPRGDERHGRVSAERFKNLYTTNISDSE